MNMVRRPISLISAALLVWLCPNVITAQAGSAAPGQQDADIRLIGVIGRVVELLPPAGRLQFLAGDSTWWQYREAECRSVYRGLEGGTNAATAYQECRERLALLRTRFLVESHSIGLMDERVRGGCVSYEPDTVAVEGVLERLTFPGPPNFESVQDGDKPETGIYMRVSSPLCVTRNVDLVNQPAADVGLVQLVLNQQGYAQLGALIGRTVEVQGTLFRAITGHHHAALLLAVINRPE